MSNEKPNLKGLLRSGANVAKKDAVPEPATPAKPTDFSHLGGKKVGHHVPERTEKEISFEHLGGKVVRSAKDHPMNQRAESKETDANAD